MNEKEKFWKTLGRWLLVLALSLTLLGGWVLETAPLWISIPLLILALLIGGEGTFILFMQQGFGTDDILGTKVGSLGIAGGNVMMIALVLNHRHTITQAIGGILWDIIIFIGIMIVVVAVAAIVMFGGHLYVSSNEKLAEKIQADKKVKGK